MSTYANMDHAGWMERHLGLNREVGRPRKGHSIPSGPLNEFQRTAVNIIGIVGRGIYNAPIADRIDWNYGGGMAFIWKGELCTFDYDQLTHLVFLCHEARIRCCVESAGPRMMRIAMWQRDDSDDIMRGHPLLDEAVTAFRRWFTADNPINYESKAVASE